MFNSEVLARRQNHAAQAAKANGTKVQMIFDIGTFVCIVRLISGGGRREGGSVGSSGGKTSFRIHLIDSKT